MNRRCTILGGLILAAVSLLLTGCFTAVDRDFLSLRDEVLPAGTTDYEKEFQHSFGSRLLGFAARFVDDEDPAASTLLRSLKKVQVGVYALEEPLEASALKNRSLDFDARMARRGFYPVVRVRDHGEIVGVYAPAEDEVTLSELIVCVLEAEEVVLVHLKGDLDELALLLAQGETDFEVM